MYNTRDVTLVENIFPFAINYNHYNNYKDTNDKTFVDVVN